MKNLFTYRVAWKSIIFCYTMMIIFVVNVCGQDRFRSTQLTFDSAQQGFPTWSPDGKQIVYSYIDRKDTASKNGLWKIDLDSKRAEHIFAGIAEHPKWSPDSRYIVFDADAGKRIKMIPSTGGPAKSILPDSFRIVNGGMPCWAPDASQIAFLEGGTLSISVVNIKTGNVTKIFHQEGMVPFPGCWTPDGKSVLIAPMELQTRKSTIWKISSDGKVKKQITGHHEGMYRYLVLSPDGSMLLYAAMEGKDIGFWIMPAEGGKSLRIVSHSSFNENPSWSPDGKSIAFTSTRSGNFDVWIMGVNMEQLWKELRVVNK